MFAGAGVVAFGKLVAACAGHDARSLSLPEIKGRGRNRRRIIFDHAAHDVPVRVERRRTRRLVFVAIIRDHRRPRLLLRREERSSSASDTPHPQNIGIAPPRRCSCYRACSPDIGALSDRISGRYLMDYRRSDWLRIPLLRRMAGAHDDGRRKNAAAVGLAGWLRRKGLQAAVPDAARGMRRRHDAPRRPVALRDRGAGREAGRTPPRRRRQWP